ncbi:hypothetical protein FA15DRAFT_504932 [Coprinopsis marcescibilis]|uniref:DUF1996 domain-containing protein n=1 Tax=Coprinopsis marcescibilis TaxID=230819 RepID=A0A5C3KQB4_COPMA|nr:hypothetical protein FA15DRAFT_504932 [Coprinopsis marcescibilis]
MKWRLLSAIGLVSPYGVSALIRFGCSQLVTQRFDPLATPGQISPHVHQIIGGDAFNLTMHPDNDLPNLSTCTTCRFKEDLSNYWTAVLYFRHTNGSYIRVPQIPNHVTGSPNGGMTVYYLQRSGTNRRVSAFPKGFRMITGDPLLRSRKVLDPTSAEAWSTSFRCWESTGFFDPSNRYPPGVGEFDTVHLPNKACAGGIRSNIFFPACWDGKNLDSPDHRSHVAFQSGEVNPSIGAIAHNGPCPSTHPVSVPIILYEIYWDTRPFNSMWPKDGGQPFVLSQGDPTGYGQHGDYLFGWEGDSLQRAMDNCLDGFGTPESCRELTVLSDAEINRCVQKTRVDETVEGEYLRELPGCNPLQTGPEPAKPIAPCVPTPPKA